MRKAFSKMHIIAEFNHIVSLVVGKEKPSVGQVTTRRRSVSFGTPGTSRERERAKRTLSAQTATLTEAVSACEARRTYARPSRGVPFPQPVSSSRFPFRYGRLFRSRNVKHNLYYMARLMVV